MANTNRIVGRLSVPSLVSANCLPFSLTNLDCDTPHE